MIELLISTISAGKSTYAKQKAKEGFIIINDDDIVLSLHSGNYQLYDPKLKVLYKAVENHIFSTACSLGKNIIIDKGLSLTKNSRSRWISLSRSIDLPISARVFKFEKPEIHATRRIQHDSRGYDFEYWRKVAEYHISTYEPPTLEEGFSEIIYQ